MPSSTSLNPRLLFLLVLVLPFTQWAAPSYAETTPHLASQTDGSAETTNGAEAHLLASKHAFAADDFASSLDAARQATKFDPARGNAAAARALGGLKAWPRAQEAAAAAYAEDSSIDHALLLAWTLRSQEKNHAAIAILKEALAGAGRGTDRKAATEQANLSRELALLYLHTGKVEAALEIVSATPSSMIDEGVTGLVLAAQSDQLDRAVPLLEKALQSTAKQPGATGKALPRISVVPRQVLHKELGTALLALGRTQEAVVHLQQAYDQGPQTAALAYRLAGAYRSLGQRQDAAALLDEFQRLRAEEDQRDTQQRSLGAALNEAQDLAAANQLQPALERVDEILAEHPLSFTAHALRGKVLFSVGQKEAGLEAMHQATLLRPGVVEFQYLKGLFLRTMGRSEEARDALQRALSLQPDLVEAHAILGGLLLELNQPHESLRHLDRAIALGANGQQIERARQLALEHIKNEDP